MDISLTAAESHAVITVSGRLTAPGVPRFRDAIDEAIRSGQSRIEVDLQGAVSRTYPSQAFGLQPGIYILLAALGCWHGDQATGPGRMTLLIRHPGEDGLRPARPDDLLRVSGVPR